MHRSASFHETRDPRRSRQRCATPAAARPQGPSWLDLVADTLGLGAFWRLRVTVRQVTKRPEVRRLIVHTYAVTALDENGQFDHATPLAAASRVCTDRELKSGVAIDLLEIRERVERDPSAPLLVVAWTEVDDGRVTSSPPPDAVVAVSEHFDSGCELNLPRLDRGVMRPGDDVEVVPHLPLVA